MFHVDSQVGHLRQVILHRPDLELKCLTPDNVADLPFDDMLWVSRAQAEHDAIPGGDQRPRWQIAPAGPARLCPGAGRAHSPLTGRLWRSGSQSAAARSAPGVAAGVLRWQRWCPAGPVPQVLPSQAWVCVPVSRRGYCVTARRAGRQSHR